VGKLKEKGATLLINLAAFPFYKGLERVIYNTIKEHVQKHQLPFIFVNQVGANDELVFAGKSFCLDGEGQPLAVLTPFQEQVLTFNTQERQRENYALQEEIESVYEALVLGIKDYFKKTGFRKALLGLSGGIDSALVCALAVAALGKENVVGISMPSPFSSLGSVEDSRQLAQNLGIDFQVISITSIYETYLNTLQEHFVGRCADLTEENIQARIRGNLLMALANKFGYLVLTTGNKSELVVGYCTLYGDMSGGLGVLSDVPKTLVYQLAHYLNREKEIIPVSIIEKAPSAELRPEQKDADTLPPYEILDRLLFLYLEEDYAPEELVQEGFAAETVDWVVKAVARSEYKRRQAVPGLKVNSKPGKMEQRMPLTAQYC
jgi:NAD+ synthase (glutamine-hydrolysing)